MTKTKLIEYILTLNNTTLYRFVKQYKFEKEHKGNNLIMYIRRSKAGIIDFGWDENTKVVIQVTFFRNSCPCLYAPRMIIYGTDDYINEFWQIDPHCNVSNPQIKQWFKDNNISRPLSKADQVLMKLALL